MTLQSLKLFTRFTRRRCYNQRSFTVYHKFTRKNSTLDGPCYSFINWKLILKITHKNNLNESTWIALHHLRCSASLLNTVFPQAVLKFPFHSSVTHADLKLLHCLIHCADCMLVCLCNHEHMNKHFIQWYGFLTPLIQFLVTLEDLNLFNGLFSVSSALCIYALLNTFVMGNTFSSVISSKQ